MAGGAWEGRVGADSVEREDYAAWQSVASRAGQTDTTASASVLFYVTCFLLPHSFGNLRYNGGGTRPNTSSAMLAKASASARVSGAPDAFCRMRDQVRRRLCPTKIGFIAPLFQKEPTSHAQIAPKVLSVVRLLTTRPTRYADKPSWSKSIVMRMRTSKRPPVRQVQLLSQNCLRQQLSPWQQPLPRSR